MGIGGNRQQGIEPFFVTMKIPKHVRWAVPAAAFMLPMLLVADEYYWWSLVRHYRRSGNISCALAKGYALQFEQKFARRPTQSELITWASEHFAADIQRMEITGESAVRWKDGERH